MTDDEHTHYCEDCELTTPILELFDSYEELGRLSIEQRDHALAAVLLHEWIEQPATERGGA